VKEVMVTKNGNGATGQLLYKNGMIVTMQFIKEGCKAFGIGAVTTERKFYQDVQMNTSPYLAEVKHFVKMFNPKKSLSRMMS